MSSIKYKLLSDTDKLGLLQLLYHDLMNKQHLYARDLEQKSLLIAETQRVYSRIKHRGLAS